MRKTLALLSAAVLLLALASTAALAQNEISKRDEVKEKTSANDVLGKLKKEEAASLDCEDVATLSGAQALFEMASEDRFKLDEDGDGVACEGQSSGTSEDGTKLGAKTGGDRDCMDFASQKAAQSYLRGNPTDPYKLDPENNGIACEIRPTGYKDPATDLVPVANARSDADLDCEDFEYREEAMMVWFRDKSDPNHLGKGEGRGSIQRDGKGDREVTQEPAVCEELPVLPSNGEALVAVPAGSYSAFAAPLALAGAWPHGGGTGVLLDVVALLSVTTSALMLLAVRRLRLASTPEG